MNGLSGLADCLQVCCRVEVKRERSVYQSDTLGDEGKNAKRLTEFIPSRGLSSFRLSKVPIAKPPPHPAPQVMMVHGFASFLFTSRPPRLCIQL